MYIDSRKASNARRMTIGGKMLNVVTAFSYLGHIGVRANIHLGGQTEFCPNGENNLFVTRPRQGEKIIMNYCSACF